MPKSTREIAHRELKRAIGNIEWADTHLLRIADVYVDAHPEIAKPIALCSDLLDEVTKLIRQIQKSF